MTLKAEEKKWTPLAAAWLVATMNGISAAIWAAGAGTWQGAVAVAVFGLGACLSSRLFWLAFARPNQ